MRLDSIPPVAAAQLTPEQRRGEAVYNELCWSCHGLYGHGDGPVARGYPDPLPDLGRIAAGQPVEVIASRMRQRPSGAGLASVEPVWHGLSPGETRAVVAYIKSFAPPGSLGNPAGGRLIYATYCVHCHGVRGAGDGRLAPTLSRRPVDLRTSDVADHPHRVFAQIRSGGTPEHGTFMPNWGRVFSDQQLWDLIAYLEVLQARR